jgi:hypothetical protein
MQTRSEAADECAIAQLKALSAFNNRGRRELVQAN